MFRELFKLLDSDQKTRSFPVVIDTNDADNIECSSWGDEQLGR